MGIVILAAGQSSRMGHAKQVALVNRVPMVVQAIRTAMQSQADDVWVITGAYRAQVENALVQEQEHYGARLHLVYNADWATGQASTVRTAIAALPTRVDAVLFLPVDQPFVPVTLVDALIDAWQAGAAIAAPQINGQVRGAPAIFDRSLFPELMALEGDVGARPLLQRHRQRIQAVPAEASWLRDIDTPNDLADVN